MEIPTYQLNDGHLIPALGLGAFRLNGLAGQDAVVSAVRAGYRLIDTAFNYDNEGVVGAAIRQAGVPREELFITSKLPGRHHAYDLAVKSVEESLARLGLEYLDLHLIHWPNPTIGLYVEAWQALIDCQRRGLIRSIGVSNFLPAHLDRIISETGVTPAINQIERHPFRPQAEQVGYNAGLGIRVEAWSPLQRAKEILGIRELANIAERHHKTVPQVVLAWHVQSGVIPIPKSADSERQRENLAVFDFELAEEEMAIMGTFADEGRCVGTEPADIHVEL
jgi:diketogulonate reductase-like aldo/keto reductase